MRKLIVLLSLCFAVGNLFAQTADSSQLKSQGDQALQAKNYPVAFTKYSQYLKQTNYQDSITAFNCGVCADRTKKYDAAAKMFDVAIKKNYNVASAYVGKAVAYRNLMKNSDYIATLKEGMEVVPGNASIEKLYAIYYLKEGQAFQKSSNIDKAEESYMHVTDVSSKKWKTDALYSLGVLFFNDGALVLKKAAPLASSNPDKYKEEKATADADFKKADEYLEKAVALSPERTEIAKLLTQVKSSMN
ncbi:hypothetical protein [uncultured Bacteroides sp.]|uniref:tetratricopeptide repeat protein n=1 Tax=uncultured Bacteroides sp. TaxID=162156 RepID=UPI002AA62D7E|nr:hypothetical protein [uncultured Bacteroides sp.]